MEQSKIWEYYQNAGDAHAFFSLARQRFMVGTLKPYQTVLNVGVGNGDLERLALEKKVNIYSLDPSAAAIQRLRDILSMGSRAQTGGAENMPLDSGIFDVVVMSEVLEHLDNDTLQLSLQEVQRVLKPGGLLLASTPYRENIEASAVVCPDCGNVFHRMGHVQTFDKQAMRELLQRNGYYVRKMFVSTFVDWRRKGVRSFLKSAIRVGLARLGEGIADPHIIVHARKHD